MTFDEWQRKHGPNGGAYDIEMQRAGWNGRKQQIEDLVALQKPVKPAPEPVCRVCGSPLGDLHMAVGNLLCGWPERVQVSDCVPAQPQGHTPRIHA